MDLEEIRKQITQIDLRIIDFISERMAFAPELVQYKKKHNITIFQPEREKQIQKKYWKFAVEKRINPEVIRKVFGLIIEETRRIQLELESATK